MHAMRQAAPTIRDGGAARFIFVKPVPKHRATVAIITQIRSEWRVLTGGFRNRDYLDRKELLWGEGRSPISSRSAPLKRSGQSGRR